MADEAMRLAKDRTERHHDRRVMLVCDLQQAATLIPDESLDFALLEAGHAYERTRDAVEAWLPKVKCDGIIVGSNHGQNFPGMIRAVDAPATHLSSEPGATHGDVWWLQKRIE